MVSDLIFAYGIHVFYERFFSVKEKKWFMRMALALFVAADFLLWENISDPYLFPVASFLTFFGVSLAYQRKISYRNFLAAFWILIFGICGELLASYLTAFFMREISKATPENALVAALASARLAFFFLALLAAKLIRHQKEGERVRYVSLLAMPLPMISVGLIIYVFSLAEFDQDTILNAGSVGAVLAVLAIVWINLITVWLFDRSAHAYQMEREAQALRKTIQVQQEHYNGEMEKREALQKMRHDYKNFLLAIRTDLAAGREEEAIKVIDGELENTVAKGSSQSGWYALDAVVNYKEVAAGELGLRFQTNYYFETEPAVASEDICIMMGNALDNAMEYLEAHPGCSRDIRIYLRHEKGVLNVKVGNEVEGLIEVTDRRFCASSKKEEGHGYGLKSIDYVAGKYDGRLILSSREGYFECGVLLYCD